MGGDWHGQVVEARGVAWNRPRFTPITRIPRTALSLLSVPIRVIRGYIINELKDTTGRDRKQKNPPETT
jgi:hypothetical protein